MIHLHIPSITSCEIMSIKICTQILCFYSSLMAEKCSCEIKFVLDKTEYKIDLIVVLMVFVVLCSEIQ